jgi:hypothetical protein
MNPEQEEAYCDALERLIDDYGSVDVFVNALNNDVTIFDAHLFQYACIYGNLPIAQWLYTNRAVRINGFCPDVDRPRLLNKYCDMGTYISINNPLLGAFYSYHFDVVRWLLSLPNIDADVSCWEEVRPLRHAIASLMDDEDRRFPMDIIDALIEKSQVLRRGEDLTPLHYAVVAPEEHRLPLVFKLLAAGADLKQSGPESDHCFALDSAQQGSDVENALQNWNAIMLLQCLNECGVAIDSHSVEMLAELAFDDQRVEDEYLDDEEEEEEDA